MRVSPSQVLAFRVGAQQLAVRGDDPLAALHGWSVQDSPPGAAALALAARTEPLASDWLDRALHVDRSVLALYNPRTATAIVGADDAAAFSAGLLPPDEAALRFVLGRALPGEDELGAGAAAPEPEEAVALAVAAVEEALDGRMLSRDDLHEALRHLLPPPLLPWCPGCGSHHARRGLLVLAGLHGRLCLAGREGRQPLFARTDQWAGTRAAPGHVDRDGAAAEVVRRHLRTCGPSTPQLFAQWAGISPRHAQRSWELVAAELAELELELDGSRPVWLLADDAERLIDPPAARGVRLLPSGDPLLLARDRELLIDDAGVRRRVWSASGSAGVVLVGGRPRALWRGRKKGRRLEVALEPFGGALGRRALAGVELEAERLAAHRGCATSQVELAAG